MKIKKIISLLLSASLCIGIFSGCGKVEEKDKKRFVTSFYPIYIFTKNITYGAENVEVINMTAPQTGCLHDYQLLPRDIKKLEGADAFIINGAGMESFMEKIYENNENLPIICASDDIPLLGEHHEHCHSEDEHETHSDCEEDHSHNSHVWTYIPYAAAEVKNITSALCLLDEKNANLYKKNSEEYIKRLNELNEIYNLTLNKFKDKKVITTDESFDYLAVGYDIEIAETLNTEHNSAPSAGELKKICDILENEKIPILKTPDSPKSAPETISRETGAKIFELDSVTSGSMTDIYAYENAMKNNLSELNKAFSK